jgi:stage V sporulation protein B
VFYAKSNSDIVLNSREILFYSGVTILPCAMAVTTVYCTQALGYANKTILPYVVGGIVRLVINFILIPNSKVNILGALVSNFIGFFVIVISNLIIIHKKTNTKFQLFNILFKPVFVGVITYFLMIFVKNKFFENSVNISCLVILTIILISFYAILLLTFGIVSANDLKRLK